MSSWVIVGATRGIGFEYVKQLSSDPKNTVIALIRSQATADPLNKLAKARKNIFVLETDISSTDKLAETAESVGEITSGKVDVLIHNAYSAGTTEGMGLSPSAFHKQEEVLRQEILTPLDVTFFHIAYIVNAFLPLIRNGQQKKIIFISSGIGDVRVTRVCELPSSLGYSVSKAAGNMLMAKYAAELKPEGISTLSLSPGWVETDTGKMVLSSPDAYKALLTSFQKMDPSVTGMISMEESVKTQLSVIHSLEMNLTGSFLSHRGNDRDWF